MRSKGHSPLPHFVNQFRDLPRDYTARRRRSRQITDIIMITVLSFLVAALIVYASNPKPSAPWQDNARHPASSSMRRTAPPTVQLDRHRLAPPSPDATFA